MIRFKNRRRSILISYNKSLKYHFFSFFVSIPDISCFVYMIQPYIYSIKMDPLIHSFIRIFDFPFFPFSLKQPQTFKKSLHKFRLRFHLF